MNLEYMDITDLKDYSKCYSNPTEAISASIRLMEVELSNPRFKIINNYKKIPIYWELHRDLLYVVRNTSLRNKYILLNRQYKPLGSNIRDGGEEVNNDAFDNLHAHIPQIKFMRLANHTLGDKSDGIFLFGPSNSPWNNRACAESYLERLKMLREKIKI
ncbi:MAG: hypothetical protein WDM70_10355 [Nitrosomonadales bacterium]